MKRRVFSILGAVLLLVVPLATGLFQAIAQAQYATITERSLKLSNSQPSAVADYEVSFIAQAVPQLGSIRIEFCSNTALFEVTCNAPTGFDASAAVLATQTGDTGFSIHPSSTASTLILTRTPGPTTGLMSAYTFSNIVNASTADSQYARYSTYPTDDATGPMQDRGGIAYALNPAFGVSTEVPPHIEFCLAETIVSANCSIASGNYASMGDFSTVSARTGQTQMVIATNAANGYTIRINGNTIASGTNIIPALSSPTFSAPGNSQFGINLRANSDPSFGQDPTGPGSGLPAADYNIPNRFVFRPGDIIASKNTTEDYRKYTVTYLVNISRNQPPGIYAGTYTYVALGNF